MAFIKEEVYHHRSLEIESMPHHARPPGYIPGSARRQKGEVLIGQQATLNCLMGQINLLDIIAASPNV